MFPRSVRAIRVILAAVGEKEAATISELTESALAAARARGAKLGWLNPARSDRKDAELASARTRRENAWKLANAHGPRIIEQRAADATFSAIAAEFKTQGIKPPRRQNGELQPSIAWQTDI